MEKWKFCTIGDLGGLQPTRHEGILLSLAQPNICYDWNESYAHCKGLQRQVYISENSKTGKPDRDLDPCQPCSYPVRWGTAFLNWTHNSIALVFGILLPGVSRKSLNTIIAVSCAEFRKVCEERFGALSLRFLFVWKIVSCFKTYFRAKTTHNLHPYTDLSSVAPLERQCPI